MRFRKSGVLGFTLTLMISLLVSSPARAAGDSSITVGDAICDLATAGYGHGSATDPFTIGTAKALAEIKDCSPDSTQHRLKTITSAAGNGTTATFTVSADGDAYGVGQAVVIQGNDPAGYDNLNARVISSTPTSVTVSSAETGTFVSGGTIESFHDFYKLTSDISLATSSTPWNDTRSAAITAVSGDGTTVTYTAANSFTTGDIVVVKGISNNDYNLGTVTIASATPTDFTVTDSTNSAASSGGTVSAQGWKALNANHLDFDGQNHTISGLTIDNAADYQGLFGSLGYANVSNLKFSGASIDQSTRVQNYGGIRVGVLAGALSAVSTDRITIGGEVISGYGYAGMLAGESRDGNHTSINASGRISSGQLLVTSDLDSAGTNFGGLFGYTNGDSLVDGHASVKVDAFAVSADSAFKVYGQNVGGLIGRASYTEVRDSSASGDVTGVFNVGGAIGQDGCCSTTKNSSASGKVSAYSRYAGYPANNIGGFFGQEGCCSSRENLSASGDIYVESNQDGGLIANVGGLMGSYGCCGTIRDSTATGDITIVQNSINNNQVYSIGGFLGDYGDDGEIVSSSSTGDVTVTSVSGDVYNVGGFAGRWYGYGALNYVHSTGNVSISTGAGYPAYRIGGFAGYLGGYGTAMGAYTSGNVTVNNGYQVGGFGGYVDERMNFIDAYATGSVSSSFDGDAYVGGFVGKTSGRMDFTRVFASGNVTAAPVTAGQSANYVGGLIGGTEGYSNVQFVDSYYKGTVTGSSEVGGLIGHQGRALSYRANRTYVAATVVATGTGAISDPVSYGPWVDASRTNFVDSTLAGKTVNDPGYIAKTSAEMKTASTFTSSGWALSGTSTSWRISAAKNGGYPYLIPATTKPCLDSETSTPAVTPSKVKNGKASAKTVIFVYSSSKLSASILKTLKTTVKQGGKGSYYTIVAAAGQVKGVPTKSVKTLATVRGDKIKAYLVKLGVNKSHITIQIKVFKIGQTPKTRILTKQLANQ